MVTSAPTTPLLPAAPIAVSSPNNGHRPQPHLHHEDRTIYFSQTGITHTLDYEVNLYENGAPAFDFNFLTIVPFNLASRILSVGVQQDSTTSAQVGWTRSASPTHP